jgi:hypothetical protein
MATLPAVCAETRAAGKSCHHGDRGDHSAAQEHAMKGLNQKKGDKKKALKTPKEKKAEKIAKKAAKAFVFPGH